MPRRSRAGMAGPPATARPESESDVRQQPVTTAAAMAVAVVIVLIWTFGLLTGDLAGTPVASTVEIGGVVEAVWRGAGVVAGLLLVLAARPTVRRLDPSGRAGAAALLLQLGGVGLVLLAIVPTTPETDGGAVLLTEGADPAQAYGAAAGLALGALLPAAGFLLAARWRSVPDLKRETAVSFVAATVALWAMLAYSLDSAPDATFGGLAQRVALTAALGWVVWLLARSLDPHQATSSTAD